MEKLSAKSSKWLRDLWFLEYLNKMFWMVLLEHLWVLWKTMCSWGWVHCEIIAVDSSSFWSSVNSSFFTLDDSERYNTATVSNKCPQQIFHLDFSWNWRWVIQNVKIAKKCTWVTWILKQCSCSTSPKFYENYGEVSS